MLSSYVYIQMYMHMMLDVPCRNFHVQAHDNCILSHGWNILKATLPEYVDEDQLNVDVV